MTDEPAQFKNEAAMQKYKEVKKREVIWLIHKLRTANTPYRKDKAEKQLRRWLETHPKLTQIIIHELSERDPAFKAGIERLVSQR